MKVLIGKKIGMTQVYDEKGVATPATIIDVSGNVVAAQLLKDATLSHIEIGKGKKKSTNKAEMGRYSKLGFVPMFKRVFKTDSVGGLTEVGNELKATVFSVGDRVDITSETKGKGFAGVIKRWKMAGGPRTHGASDRERAIGSIGSRTIPGRVFKGHKMAGHMGTRTKTISGLKVVDINEAENIVLVSGSIPGPRKCYVVIKESKK